MNVIERAREKFDKIIHRTTPIKVRGYLVRQTPIETWEVLVLERLERNEDEIQVPGGTVDPGEDFKHALVREMFEETGHLYEGPWQRVTDDLIYRPKRKVTQLEVAYFMQADYLGETSWTHAVTGSGPDKDALFRLSWMPLDQAFCRLRPWMADHLEIALENMNRPKVKTVLRNWIGSRSVQSSSL